MSNESTYKLRKRIKELEMQLSATKTERNRFREILSEIFDSAIKFEALNSKSILNLFKDVAFKIKYY